MLRLDRLFLTSAFAAILASTGCAGRQVDAELPLSGAGAATTIGAVDASKLAGTGVTHMLQAVNTADNTYVYLENAGHPVRRFNVQDNSNPIGTTFDPRGAAAYVAVANEFLSIDVATKKILHRLRIDGCAAQIIVTPDSKTALVPCGNSSLLFISLPGSTLRSTVALSGLENPIGVTVDSAGKAAYVVGNSGMAIVDIARARQTGTVSLPGGECWTGEITGVALVERLHRAYVATCDGSTRQPFVAVVDTLSKRLLKTINVGIVGGEWPIDVVAPSRKPFVYVSVQNADGVHGQLVAIDTTTSTVSKNENLKWAPVALAISPNQSAIFAMTWQGIIWFDIDAKGFSDKVQGPVGVEGVDEGFGHFIR